MAGLSTDMTARMEAVDPFEQTAEYGGDQLLVDLRNESNVTGDDPPIDDALVDALESGNYEEAAEHLPSVRDWFRKEHSSRYQVLDQGSMIASIPFLVAGAPDVNGAEVTATQESTSSRSGELTFKIAGSGLGAGAKLTVGSGTGLTCIQNETLVASTLVPVKWELRASLKNEDDNWLYTELDLPKPSSDIKVEKSNGPLRLTVVQHVTVNQGGGVKPFDVNKSFATEANCDFSVGFKIDALGLDTSLKITSTQTFETKLSAALPSGHTYVVDWLGGPWGVKVSAK